MADLTPTAVSGSSDFNSGAGHDETKDVLSDLLANRTEIYSLITSIRRRQRSNSPPANPNTGDIWECGQTGGGYTIDTVYKWDGSAWTAETATSINTTARNIVIQGAVTTAGATALFTGSTAALTVQLNATATPMVVTWMNGNDGTSGKVDIVGTVAADSTTFWSSLPQSSTVYLYVDFDGTSTISGGFSTIAPVYQDYAPPVTSSGTHWIDDNQGKVFLSNGSAWSQVYRVFVGTATTDTTKVTAVSIYDYNVLRANVTGNVTGTATGNIPRPAVQSEGDILYRGASEWVALTAGTTGQFLQTVTTTAAKTVQWATPSSSISIALYQEQQNNGVAGGTFTAGAWRTRQLNTEVFDTIGASVVSAQVTIPAGTYDVSAVAEGVAPDNHKLRFYNITTSASVTLGVNAYNSGNTGHAYLFGQFTITATNTFELQHYCSATRATDGFGIANSFGVNEVYSTLAIRKV